MRAGTIGVLNVGAGDTKLVFDKNDPAECIRAGRIVKDMLKRGYALLVDTGEKHADGKPIYRRATGFDENTAEYIIADLDPSAAEDPGTDIAQPDDNKPSRRKQRRVAASSTSAVAVPHRAGG